AGGGRRREGAALADQGADGLALDVLHHEIPLASRLADVVDPNEVLVLELRPDAGLAAKARDRPRVVHPLGGEALACPLAVEPGIACQINATHPSLADRLEQEVTVDLESRRPAREELLGLPEGQITRLDRLPRETTICLVGDALLRSDRLPAG